MENVKVTDHGSFHSNIALSWEHGGFRFHVWEDDPTIILKNPPNGTIHRGPGYFRTRKLDACAKANAAMLAKAREIAQNEKLYEKAAEDKQREKEASEQKQRDAIALGKKRENAEAMYTALEKIAGLWPDPGMCAELVPEWVGPNDGRMRADTLWFALNAAREALGMPTYPRPEHWDRPHMDAVETLDAQD
jgi:hypothetical protein